MARLIDADQFEVLFWDATGDTSYDQGFDDGVKFVAEKIDAAPTIDAIPVEWLKEHDGVNIIDIDGNVYARRRITVVEALSMWQKEQEARA